MLLPRLSFLETSRAYSRGLLHAQLGRGTSALGPLSSMPRLSTLFDWLQVPEYDIQSHPGSGPGYFAIWASTLLPIPWPTHTQTHTHTVPVTLNTYSSSRDTPGTDVCMFVDLSLCLVSPLLQVTGWCVACSRVWDVCLCWNKGCF